MVMDIVIVGGGTAGWMTAAYLRNTLGRHVAVTVVESANIPTIGVGEATFSTVRHFFESLGLKEIDWMPECDATYKLGIRFENWRGHGDVFYHPFERLRRVDGFDLTDWWLRIPASDRFDADCFVAATLCDNRLSPRTLDGELFEKTLTASDHRPVYRTTLADQSTQFPYAYHFDAARLALFLSRYATQRGVRHVLDNVVDVVTDERGWIDHLVTAEHGRLRGDLYVDCTGFRSLLLGQALGEPFESFEPYLPNDRAVALRVPFGDDSEPTRPCTTATAMESGWIWTIPLRQRIGTGYVYSSQYAEPEEAERALRAFVGAGAASLPANHIRMKPGRYRRAWVANCVAIGLSGNFVEPLESTTIFFIQHAVEQLVKHFPGAGWEPRLRDAFNDSVRHCVNGVLEFLALHYRAAAREDTVYWRDAKTRPLPGDLADRLERWDTVLPAPDTIYPYYHGFEAYSYVCMLLGLGGVPVRPLPVLDHYDDTAARREFAALAEQAAHLTTILPGHQEYFERVQAG